MGCKKNICSSLVGTGIKEKCPKDEFQDFRFFSFSSVLVLNHFKMAVKVVLELLLDIWEVLLEVRTCSGGPGGGSGQSGPPSKVSQDVLKTSNASF